MELVDDVNSKQIEDIFSRIDTSTDKTKPFPSLATSPDDTSVVESFLAGKTCLTGI